MLVSIYGHAELFIEEYVHMLADRMLSGQSNKVHIDNENRYVEILKQRFGDAGLQGCDVMLRDYADSSMINQLIEKELKTEPCSFIPTNTLVISREYWPEVKFSPIELPKQLTTIQDAYTKAYRGLKSHRTLHWSPNYGKLVRRTNDRIECILLGQVHLEIEIGGKPLDFSVTPFHAAIIYKFLDKGKSSASSSPCHPKVHLCLDTWTISDLSSALKCTTACIRKRINLWQNCGLLKEEAKDTFRLVEDTSKIPSSNAAQIPANLGLDLDEMNTDHHGEHDKKEHEDTVRHRHDPHRSI